MDHPLGACRTWGIESEKVAERGQIVTISPAHSGTMVQESGEIWTAKTRLQPILPKSDRLLGDGLPISPSPYIHGFFRIFDRTLSQYHPASGVFVELLRLVLHQNG